MDLIDILRKSEGKRLEFKRDLSSPTGLLRTVVAFANTAGGTILIGVEDGSRHVIGVKNPLRMEEKVANLVNDSISARVLPDIELLSFQDTHVLSVQVYPSASRPHFLNSAGPESGIYVRVGSTNRRADSDLVAEMQRFTRGESFDETPVPELDSEALDFRLASELFAKFRKLRKKDLETLRFLTEHQGQRVPTVGGLLLFGHDRLTKFPEAYIQMGRFAGVDKSQILETVDCRLNLVQCVEHAVAFVEKHTTEGIVIGSVRREVAWSLPPRALREAIVNAVAHADYSLRDAPIRIAIFEDRLEVENPGLLPFGLSIDDLPRGVSKLRNRTIGRAFKELELVEQWGSGVQRMIEACETVGLPLPVWEEIGTRLRVTFRTEMTDGTKQDDRDQAILDLLNSDHGYSTKEISEHIGLSTRATRTRLLRLIDSGLVSEVASGPNDPKRRYFKAL